MRTKKNIIIIAVVFVLAVSLSIMGTYATMQKRYHGGIKTTGVTKSGDVILMYNDGTIMQTGHIEGTITGYKH